MIRYIIISSQPTATKLTAELSSTQQTCAYQPDLQDEHTQKKTFFCLVIKDKPNKQRQSVKQGLCHFPEPHRADSNACRKAVHSPQIPIAAVETHKMSPTGGEKQQRE